MKYYIRFLLLLLALSLRVESVPLNLYVSLTGSDTNNGTSLTDAFATLPAVQNKIREIKKTVGLPNGGIIVNIEGGNYQLGDTWVLTAEDSGTASSPIVYKGSSTSLAVISGDKNLPSAAFSPVTNTTILGMFLPEAASNIRQVDLKSLGIVNYGVFQMRGSSGATKSPLELYFNGQAMTIARYPNEGFLLTNTSLSTTFVYNEDRPSRWTQELDPWAFGYWYFDWADFSVPIESIDTTAKKITLESVGSYGLRADQRYYAWNLLSEIDAPGEYYLDRSTGILYFWPPSSLDATSSAKVSMLDNVVNFTSVDYVTFQNVIVENGRQFGFNIQNGNGVTLRNLEVRNMGGTGINSGGTYNFTIQSCSIHDCGSGAMTVSGGNRYTLAPSGIRVVNNEATRNNRWARTYKPAVGVNGVGVYVGYNHFYDLPHVAILHSGNDHIMEYNKIHDVCTDTGDAGAIYSGRSWTARGNIIRNNFLYRINGPGHLGTTGVYLDDQYSSAEITSNIFYDVYMNIDVGGGRDNIVKNNILINGSIGVFLDSRGMPGCGPQNNASLYQSLSSIPYRSEPWKSRYPTLYNILDSDPHRPEGNIFSTNIFYTPYRKQEVKLLCNGASFFNNTNNISLAWNDAHFEDPGSLNFQMASDHPAFAYGFQPIDFAKIGSTGESRGPIITSPTNPSDTTSTASETSDEDANNSATNMNLPILLLSFIMCLCAKI